MIQVAMQLANTQFKKLLRTENMVSWSFTFSFTLHGGDAFQMAIYRLILRQ